ncbi:hypothetical protein AB6A40_010786 [Gnathostoma spinigerum]|uniref:Uncharacterized protein n=1 Tax=Gnathostoma spinigerum TaxID=75299 RepID=A0ABD6F333_9BILA
MFMCFSRHEVRHMLPSLLRGMTTKELYKHCVSELEEMSEKRIIAIMDGKELFESSASEDSASGNSSDTQKTKLSSPKSHLEVLRRGEVDSNRNPKRSLAEIAAADSTT